MNLEQAVAMTNMRKQPMVLSLEGQESKTAREMAELVFELSAAAGEPYRDAAPEVWAARWLASKKFVLVDIDPRQVAVPYVNRISHSKVLATMQASASAMPPIVVDVNRQRIGTTSTGYVPSLIVVDGKHRHRAQMLCGRDRISAWVGEKAMMELQARAEVRKHFVIDRAENPGRPLSKIEVAAALSTPTGGSPVAVTRQDTGDGGSRPTGGQPPMRSNLASAGAGGASAGAGPGGGVSGMNPQRTGIYSDREVDPSDRTQSLDPSDKEQFSHGAPKGGDPSQQSPGSGVGKRTRPSSGASNSEMSRKRRMQAGPIKVKKIVTDKKRRMKAVAPPGRESQVLKLKEKFGEDSAVPFKIAWSQKNRSSRKRS